MPVFQWPLLIFREQLSQLLIYNANITLLFLYIYTSYLPVYIYNNLIKNKKNGRTSINIYQINIGYLSKLNGKKKIYI